MVSNFHVSPCIIDSLDFPITGITACNMYGLCAADVTTLEYRVPYDTNNMPFEGSIVYFGDGKDYETTLIGGRLYTSYYQAIYDACYTFSDDSLLEEVFETLKVEGDLSYFFAFAKERGMSEALISRLQYLYFGGSFAPVPSEWLVGTDWEELDRLEQKYKNVGDYKLF